MYYIIEFDNGGFMRTDHAGPEEWESMNATPVSMTLHNEEGKRIRELVLVDVDVLRTHTLHLKNRIKKVEKMVE